MYAPEQAARPATHRLAEAHRAAAVTLPVHREAQEAAMAEVTLAVAVAAEAAIREVHRAAALTQEVRLAEVLPAEAPIQEVHQAEVLQARALLTAGAVAPGLPGLLGL